MDELTVAAAENLIARLLPLTTEARIADLQCLTYQEVAEALRVSVRTVKNLVEARQLPVIHVAAGGGAPRVRVRDLEAYQRRLAA